MAVRKKNKEDKSKKWTQRVLRRQQRKEEGIIKQHKPRRKQKSVQNNIADKTKIEVIEELQQNAILKDNLNRDESQQCGQKSIVRKLASGLFYPITFLLSYSISKVNDASNYIKRPFQNDSNVERFEELENRISRLEAEVNSLLTVNNKISTENKHVTIQNVPLPAPIPMAAPPPPPPLPPPPPPMMKILPTKIMVPKSVKKIENPDKKAKPENPQITQELLSTVTLKKVSNVLKDSNKENRKKSGSALVTLSQLKNVKLKRTTIRKSTPGKTGQVTSASKKQKSGKKSSERKRTPENLFKNRLRRSNIVRSPGGTPLVKNNYEMSLGEGLTPMLSNALKKKFHNAKPMIATPEGEEASPTAHLNFESPNLSPAAL